MKTHRNILVYAPINHTIVDGSSVWLRSICQVLGMLADTSVDLLAFAAPRDHCEDLNGVTRVWYPSDRAFTGSGLPGLSRGETLPPQTARDALLIVEKLKSYDYLLVRGSEAAWHLSQDENRTAALIVYLTDVEEKLLWEDPDTSEDLAKLRATVEAAKLVLCQTEQLGTLLQELCPAATPKLAYLPPMVPDAAFALGEAKKPKRASKTAPVKMLYAGKFAREWAIDELLDVCETFGAPKGRLETHIFGDKFNKSSDGFVARTQGRLSVGTGFTWHGAVSRQEMLAQMPQFDLGYSFRHAALDASPEISTKLIEYVATGVAPILNRTPTHEEYFGKDYPFFANTAEELHALLAGVLEGSLSTKGVLKTATLRVEKHKMQNIAGRLEGILKRIEPLARVEGAAKPKPKLLIVSHDLKFMGDLELKLFNSHHYDVQYVVWPRYQSGGEAETLAAMKTADVIFCEWALENAVLCAQHKRPDQKLIVRFHRFEMVTNIPQRIDMDKVDAMVTVSDHMVDHMKEAYGWPEDKLFMVPNSIDTALLERPKIPDAAFNLGVLGALPKLKRLDHAVNLLELLRQEDPRFSLHVKSLMPWELPWIWNSADQYAFYAHVFDRIRRNAHLQGAVQLDAHGPDVARWFEKIGWILSLSDVESFHLAGIEGMASGALPVVLERRGASGIFPKPHISGSIEEAAQKILDTVRKMESDPAGYAQEQSNMQQHAAQYDREIILQKWQQLLAGL